MGQRLVIANYTTELEPTNAIYYHWSAYTNSALEELNGLRDAIVDYYENLDTEIKTEEDQKNHFNLACLSAISGITGSDEKSLKYIQSLNPDYTNEDANRNEGIISFTDEGVENLLFWSEGTVCIYWEFNEDGTPNFEKTTFDFNSLVFNEVEEELVDEGYYSRNQLNNMKLHGLNYDLEVLSFDDITELQDDLPSVWYDNKAQIFRCKIE